VALALTIPGIVESQELHSVHAEPDGVSFTLTFDFSDTATYLMQAVNRGERIELVVLTTDVAIFALDDVYVTSASYGAGDPAIFHTSLQAGAVRRV
jgi:hypothetical protein